VAEPGQRIYRTQSGDWWDLIALRVYGQRIGQEYLMHHLIEANYQYRYVWRFAAGVELVIPELPPRERKPIVPWTTILNA
jgi:phage tail protein X